MKMQEVGWHGNTNPVLQRDVKGLIGQTGHQHNMSVAPTCAVVSCTGCLSMPGMLLAEGKVLSTCWQAHPPQCYLKIDNMSR